MASTQEISTGETMDIDRLISDDDRIRTLTTTISRGHQQRQRTSNVGLGFYKKRWLVLAAFCMCSLGQSLQCNTWSPILDTLSVAYGWSDSFVALLPAVSNAGTVLLSLPMMYLVQVRGQWISDHCRLHSVLQLGVNLTVFMLQDFAFALSWLYACS